MLNHRVRLFSFNNSFWS